MVSASSRRLASITLQHHTVTGAGLIRLYLNLARRSARVQLRCSPAGRHTADSYGRRPHGRDRT